jgi:hypothetical protein
MMTYAQFKEYLARFVWRDGDTNFETELDNLIKMGEARLNRDLRIQRMSRVQSALIQGDSIQVPDDYLEMRVVTTDSHPSPLQYISPFEMERIRVSNPTRFQPVYTIAGDRIRFAGASAGENRTVVLTYYAKIPNFAGLDESWLADEYLDLYTYAVLRHSASYLHDDARVALWQNEYAETLASVMEDETRRRYAGSPLVPRMPGVVA